MLSLWDGAPSSLWTPTRPCLPQPLPASPSVLATSLSFGAQASGQLLVPQMQHTLLQAHTFVPSLLFAWNILPWSPSWLAIHFSGPSSRPFLLGGLLWPPLLRFRLKTPKGPSAWHGVLKLYEILWLTVLNPDVFHRPWWCGGKKVACCISEQRMLQTPRFQPLLPPQTVDPEGIQDAEKQATGSRWLRCISKEWL